MVILDVIPLVFLPRNQDHLVSYFHTTPLPVGSVVQISFNNRKIKAIVAACDEIARRKAVLKKQATFTLKKIDKVFPKLQLLSSKIQVARDLADYYLVPLGIAMRAVFLHPEEKSYKKYLISGPVLDLPDLETFQASRFKIKIVDMRKEIRDANYSIFSRYLKEALQTYDKLIIFVPRKGYANFLRCETCGYTITCLNCSVSLTLHATSYTSHELQCHHCGYQQAIPKTCPNCKSYNLKGKGAGIDKVEAELIKFFSYQNLAKPKIAQLTSDTKKLPEDWQILLATQSLFQYRDKLRVPYLAVMNADALIHIPDYRAEEMLLRQTLLLAGMTDHLLVQTYNPQDPALVAAATNKVDEFWQNELEQRKAFGYPPFVKLIKLTYRNRDPRIAQRVAHNVKEMLEKTLHDTSYTLQGPYPALISKERGFYIWNVLLKIPDPKKLFALRSQLYALPSDWTIDVDPMSVV